tara:strand:+ start:171 stop:1145 length:975 start_codon:yes stop_codon:yes gene_type:complete
MEKILLIGGAGYVGTELVDILIDEFKVTVFDLFLYGDNIPDHKNLIKIKGDVRDEKHLSKVLKEQDYIIHLACISNDPSFDLDPLLGKSINYDPFEPLVKLSKENGVKRFVYASSSSVYGIKSEKNVDENCSLEPITDYSKYKAKCEEILLKYTDNNFLGTVIRPATVCGYSKRQRLDLVVNILTNLAFNKGEILVFGGAQLRPNINIKDMCRVYYDVIKSDKENIKGEIFNVGFENYSVQKLANIVSENINKKISIKYVPTNDNRSYHISSKKVTNTMGFKTNFTIEDAVIELRKAFEENKLKDPLNNEMYFNIKRMKSINLK